MNNIDKIVSVETEYRPGDIPTLWVGVTAIVEDFVVVHQQTLNDPEELGPAECFMEFTVGDYEEDLVMNEPNIRELIEQFGTEWKLTSYDD